MPNKEFETVATISLWTSQPEKKTDYNGKVQWANSEGNIDFQDKGNSRLVLLKRKETKNGKTLLEGGIFKTDKKGKLQEENSITLFPNESDNPKAPVASGKVDDELRVAVWKNDSDNERAPIFKGKIQKEATEDQESSIDNDF
jgi:hypothetical protein